MSKRVITASILGGVAVFIWCMASWMLLPWHKTSFAQFENESSVTKTLSENAPKSGIYLIPYISDFSGDAKAEHDKKYTEGPLAFVAFSKEGGNDPQMKQQMLVALVMDLIGAFLIASLLAAASGLSYVKRVAFVASAGLAVGILGNVPNYNWWHFPLNYTGIAIADTFIGWLIAGIFMAAVIRKK